jgi:hypothetical protein
LAKFEPKVFGSIEALGEGKERRGLLLLREEVGIKPRQPRLSFGKAVACLVSMNLQKRKRVKKGIILGITKFIFLTRLSC